MKVAIVGGSPSSQMLAPFNDEEWQIWVLGNQLKDYEGKRVTRVFEIHDDLSDKDPNYPDWLNEQGYPMIVGENGVEGKYYPEKEVNKLIGEIKNFGSEILELLSSACKKTIATIIAVAFLISLGTSNFPYL